MPKYSENDHHIHQIIHKVTDLLYNSMQKSFLTVMKPLNKRHYKVAKFDVFRTKIETMPYYNGCVQHITLNTTCNVMGLIILWALKVSDNHSVTLKKKCVTGLADKNNTGCQRLIPNFY